VPFGAVAGPIVIQSGFCVSTRVITFAGDPKKWIGKTIPAKITATITRTSFTTLARAVACNPPKYVNPVIAANAIPTAAVALIEP
jgi:hypothetical protein